MLLAVLHVAKMCTLTLAGAVTDIDHEGTALFARGRECKRLALKNITLKYCSFWAHCGASVAIDHCTVTHACWCGIGLSNDRTKVKIVNSSVRECGGAGVFVHDGAYALLADVSSCNNASHGLHACLRGKVHANIGCSFDGNAMAGVQVNHGGVATLFINRTP